MITFRNLTAFDASDAWKINEQGLPGVGQVSKDALRELIALCVMPLAAFEDERLVGFVLCLLPGTSYHSLNYRWFNQRYEQFLYVDRIAVATAYRNRGLGTKLYERVFQYARGLDSPTAAEVNLEPPNPGSMRFHRRHDFLSVGELQHPTYRVAMLLRSGPSSGDST